jgi:hypothetical protein
MSVRGLTAPCPHCGDEGPFFLVQNVEAGLPVFRGFRCGVCPGYWDARESDKADHPDDFPQPKLTISFSIETRPSVFSGHCWMAVLTYKGQEWTELLPYDIPHILDTDPKRGDAIVDEALEKLRQQIRPVLMAEDGQE